jgi:acetyl esterase/lipase
MLQSVAAGTVFLVMGGLWTATTTGQDESLAQTASVVAVPTAPGQPSSGPGSSDYSHAAYQVSRGGAGADRFWLFTPDQPRPTSAPLLVFLHGWGATEPSIYGAWIKHLVRRGNIVLFPRYQASLRDLPKQMTGHAVNAIRSGIDRLQTGPVRPDLTRVAFVGHSLGAIMSANIAGRAERYDVPRPAALFLAEPTFAPALGSYDQIAPDTLLAVVVGADVKRDASAMRILQGSSLVPPSNKLYVAIPSDHHGSPPLVSDHFAPCAAERLGDTAGEVDDEWRLRTRDALDYFGYWRRADALLDAAFAGQHRDLALGDSPQLRFMGAWSDGTPVREAIVRSFSLGDADRADASR